MREHRVRLRGYCLMPNHVHLILIPETAEGLSRLIRKTHGGYSRAIHEREGWTGHLFAGRFYSVPMDEEHAGFALIYVEQNPVRAGLVECATDWPWSSARERARAFAEECAEGAGSGGAIAEIGSAATAISETMLKVLRYHTRIGRPLGKGLLR